MSQKKISLSLNLPWMAGIVGAVVAFCTTPAFVGIGGVGMSALVGLGTGLGTLIGGLAGAVALGAAGLAVGLAIGIPLALLAGKKKVAAGTAIAGLVGGAVIGGIGGSVYGAFAGYEWTRNALVDKTCQAPFNDAAVKACAKTNKKAYTLSLAPNPAFTHAAPRYAMPAPRMA